MTSIFIISLTALLASALTLFSGFGLGTLLMPAFAFFFPLDVAIAMTAIVHFANNIFKLILLGKNADRAVVFRFGLPAVVAAFSGAQLLAGLARMNPLGSYEWGEHLFIITPVKLAIGCLIIVFAALEILPAFKHLAFSRAWLPVGGMISGFLGGISGHQGALRSAFLIRAGLTKESFIASGVVIACLVDLTRLATYAAHLQTARIVDQVGIILAATGAAFFGVVIGTRLVKKTTWHVLEKIVSGMLLLIGFALATGLL